MVNYCEPNRYGPLCGKCKDGYSESLFSTECIPNSRCTYATLFWLVIAAYGLGYVIFFIGQEEINAIVDDFSDWMTQKATMLPCFKKKKSITQSNDGSIQNQHSGNMNSHEMSQRPADQSNKNANTSNEDGTKPNEEDQKKEAAYLAIFMYYVQVPTLLKINIFYHDFRSPPFETISTSIKNIFSFNTFGLHLNTCIFKGVTAIVKTWIKSAFILYLFLIWGIVWIMFMPLNHLFRKTTLAAKWPTDITLKARFLAALVNLLLYTYQYFAENSFNMLKCISIVDRPKSVLFIDAQKECYENWQFVIFAFTVIYVIPFSIVLLYAPSLLYRRLISVKLFIISVLFPLFSSPNLIYLFYKHKRPKQEQYRAVQSEESTPEMSIGSVDAIVGVIFDPYRQDLGYGLCWEGVIAFRRLILVIAATLISDVLIRHIILTLICLFSLLAHLKIQPFAMKSCNLLENISLTILTMVSVMNLLKSSYFQSGESPIGTSDSVMYYYDWLEAALLGFIPIIIGSFAALTIIIGICGLVIDQIIKRWQNRRHRLGGYNGGNTHARTVDYHMRIDRHNQTNSFDEPLPSYRNYSQYSYRPEARKYPHDRRHTHQDQRSRSLHQEYGRYDYVNDSYSPNGYPNSHPRHFEGGYDEVVLPDRAYNNQRNRRSTYQDNNIYHSNESTNREHSNHYNRPMNRYRDLPPVNNDYYEDDDGLPYRDYDRPDTDFY